MIGTQKRCGTAALIIVAITAWQALGLAQAPYSPEASPAPDPSPPSFVSDGTLDIEAAVAYFNDLYRSESSRGEASLIISEPDRERTLRMKMWTEGTEKSLIVIEEPAREKGTATLKVGDNLWNFLPRIKQTIRIPPSMMQQPWMGSDFTNDDLVRESSFSEDYDYELVGKSDDPEGWLIRFTAKPDLVGLWNRFDLWVDAGGALPIKAEYYDRKDRLARVLEWSEVKVFDGRKLPSRMTLVPQDPDKEGERTELVYHDIEFGVALPPDMFSLSRLEQGL